jgi:hypothetical protein
MVGAQEGGDENHCGAVAVWGSQPVIDGRGMQQNQLGCTQHFAQDGEIRFLKIPRENIGAAIFRSNLSSSH